MVSGKKIPHGKLQPYALPNIASSAVRQRLEGPIGQRGLLASRGGGARFRCPLATPRTGRY